MIRSFRFKRPTLFAAAFNLAIAIAVMCGLHIRAHRPLDTVYQVGWMLAASAVLWSITCAIPLLMAALLRRGLFCIACRWAGTVFLVLLSTIMLVQVR